LIKKKGGADDDGDSSSVGSVIGSSRRSSLSDVGDDDDDSGRLLAQIQNLQARLREACAYIDEINNKNDILEADNAHLQNRIERLTQDRNDLDRRYHDWYQAQLDGINSNNLRQAQQLESRIQQLQATLRAVDQENATLRDNLAQMGPANAQLTAEVARLTDQLRASEQQNAVQLTQLNAMTQQSQQRVASLTQRIGRLQDTVAQQQENIAQHEARIRQLSQEAVRNQYAITEAQRALEAARAELAQNQRHILELQGDNMDKDRQILDRERINREQEAEIQRLRLAARSGNAAAAAALTVAEQQLQLKQRELAAAKAARQASDRQQQATADDLAAAQRRHQELEGQIAAALNGTAAEQAQKADLQSRLDVQRALMDRLAIQSDEDKASLESRLSQADRANHRQQTEIARLEAENNATVADRKRATDRLFQLQGELASIRKSDVDARRQADQRIEAERAEADRLGVQSERQARELDTMKQRQEAAEAQSRQLQEQLQAQERERQDILELLKGGLTKKLTKVANIIQRGSHQIQAQFRGRVNGIEAVISNMQNAAQNNALGTQIDVLKQDVLQAGQLAQPAHQEQGQQEEEEEEAPRPDAIKARLMERIQDMDQDRSEAFRKRIADASTLADECAITKAILILKLNIIRAKIRLLPEDTCKQQHNAEVVRIDDLISRIDCRTVQTVESIRTGCDAIIKSFKELREALGDKLQTFVVMRGGGGGAVAAAAGPAAAAAGAQDILLDAGSKMVGWTGSQPVKFSGVFGAEADNSAKYAEVKPLLDKIRTDGTTVVIFGYGYSGSGKTHTLFGKRIEDALKIFALADEAKMKAINAAKARPRLQTGKKPLPIIEDLQDKMKAVKVAVDQRAYAGAIEGLKQFLKEKTYDDNEVGRIGDVEGIAQIAIRNYIASGCAVTLEEVFEMYDDSYYFEKGGVGDGNYEKENPAPRPIKLYPIYGYNIDGKIKRWGEDRANECVNPYLLNYDIDDMVKFNEVIRKVEQTRKNDGHIKPTPNNPESSRGHLFLKLKIRHRATGTEGRLIICDMGGRENPVEIWENELYCPSKKTGGSPIPISKTKSGIAYTDDGTEVQCTSDPISFTTAFTGVGTGGIRLETALQKGTVGNKGILKTLKQGFFVNDSLNELLHVFGYNKGVERLTNWTSDRQGVWSYNPEVRATKFSEHTRMKFIFDKFKEESKCKITFCTFACIRPEVEFKDDNVKTLNFARAVNSCSSAGDGGGGGAAAAQGGAKTRRKRSQGKVCTQRRRRRIVKPKSHPVTVVTTQRRNMRDKKKGHRTRKMK
jgi:predicted  nucleic acid-binding Zn-ribbon protein